MNWQHIFKFLTVFQLIDISQHSYVQNAKHRIRADLRNIIDHQDLSSSSSSPHHHEHYHENSGRRVHRLHGHHRNRWSSGHRKSMEHHHFTGWSAWSICNDECIKRRERYCKAKRKCGFTKHVEERKCWHCHPKVIWPQQPHKHVDETHHHQQQQQQQTINHGGSPPQSIIINAAAASSGTPHQVFVLPTQKPTLPSIHETIVHHHIPMPVLQEIVGHHHHEHQHQHQLQYQPHKNSHSSYEVDNDNDDDDDGDDDDDDELIEEQPNYPNENVETVPEISVDEDEELFATSLPPTQLPNSMENFAQNDYEDNIDVNNNRHKHYHNQNGDDYDDFYVLNTRKPKYKKKRQPKPIYIDAVDYDELEADEHEAELTDGNFKPLPQQRTNEEFDNADDAFYRSVQSRHNHKRKNKNKQRKRRQHLRQRQSRQRNLQPNGVENGVEGDTFQYEDFDFDQNALIGTGIDEDNIENGYTKLDSQYNDSYEDNNDYNGFGIMQRNASFLIPSKEKATPVELIPRHRRLYSKWSRWTKCSPKCTTRRYKKCRIRESCGREVLREIAYCYTEGSFCQQWLQAQVQRTQPYELRPMAASRRRDISVDNGGTQSNSIDGDFIMNSKGYRGPEYTPMKLKCGIAPIRGNQNKRSMYNMLKIIGGKASRKGEWPWQVAIFNRFKEAFCGGTLIAPHWVLTAAHCVRKVLYVRIGEHNLDYEDGTELQLRVLKSFKHPNFDKKTVDSDVALLRLPKPVNTTTWIGFSCLPRPYQPLPKNIDCTVIGWGKRRNRDAAGTSVLHQAEVPIISMDNCRSVYQDYTITKNMFCAGHKRGRIDTCAGDSGGPLLCRDTTKPNHPWTIFGITSFGDGCAKRNKFGIYAKVPNYVDWVWSVINCNGNCKLHQRNFG